MNKGKKQAGAAMRRRESSYIRRRVGAGVNPFQVVEGHLMLLAEHGYLVFAK